MTRPSASVLPGVRPGRTLSRTATRYMSRENNQKCPPKPGRSGGAIVEIAVIDACSGTTLLDTLVNPGVPIQPGAQAIHGITDADAPKSPTRRSGHRSSRGC